MLAVRAVVARWSFFSDVVLDVYLDTGSPELTAHASTSALRIPWRCGQPTCAGSAGGLQRPSDGHGETVTMR